MAFPYYFRAAVSWVVRWITQGKARPQVEYMAAEKFPDFSPLARTSVIEHGYLAIQFARDVNVLQPNQPFVHVLAGFDPTAQQVTASFSVRVKVGDAEPVDKFIRRRVSWSMNYQEVLDQLRGDIDELTGNYPGSAVVSITVVPPLLY